MDLLETVEYIRGNEKELALFNLADSDGIANDVSNFFDTQNVRICTYRTAGDGPEIAVLSSRDVVLGQISLSRLRELIRGSSTSAGGVGIADIEHEELLAHLKETTFVSHDTEQMLYASREVEDRARRIGKGTIHAGFQTALTMTEQEAIYTDLGNRGVTVHMYGVPDGSQPSFTDATVHTVRSEEIANAWFVVYDGNGNDTQKSALLAEQRGLDHFYGAWTYDATIVDWILTHIEMTYLSENGNRPQPDK